MNLKRSKYRNRKGGAVVETALCLPLILLILGATVELTTTIYLKESLTIAAFEGARVAVSRGGTNTKVLERVSAVLDERHISMKGYPLSSSILITPDAGSAEMMEPIAIQVIGPTAGNTVSPFRLMRFITPPDMSATVVMRKEFTLETE